MHKNTVFIDLILRKKLNSIAYHQFREAVDAGTTRTAKKETKKDIADLFTNVLSPASRVFTL